MRSWIVLVVLVAVGAGCGGPSYRYDTGSVRPVPGAGGWATVGAEVLDARADGEAARPPESPVEREQSARALAEVREAVRDHLARAGVATGEGPAPGAPADPSELGGLLQSARAAGRSSVTLVRLHEALPSSFCGTTAFIAPITGILPWIILDSIPLWGHGGIGAFEVIVVSTEDGAVLGRSLRVAAFAENVSAWGCGGEGVMHDMLRRAMQHALTDVAAQATAGWPRRRAAHETPALVFGRTTRVAEAGGGRVVGLGWSIAAPPGYELQAFDPSIAEGAARLTRSEHENLLIWRRVLVAAPTAEGQSVFAVPGAVWAYEPHRANSAADERTVTLMREAERAGDRTVDVAGRPTTLFQISVEGRPAFVATVVTNGLLHTIACTGSASECEAAITSFSLDESVFIADRRRND